MKSQHYLEAKLFGTKKSGWDSPGYRDNRGAGIVPHSKQNPAISKSFKKEGFINGT